MDLPGAAARAPAEAAGHAIRLLGPLEVRDGARVVDVAGVKRQAVLVLLVLHEGRPVPLERIITRLWPDRPPATAAAAVRNNVSALRRLLAPLDAATIGTVGSAYVLRMAPGALDAQSAREGVERGSRLLARDELPDAERELRAALSLWRGGLLPGLRQAGYDWAEIAELEELRLRALEGLVEVVLRRGRHREVVPGLRRLVRLHPEREPFHRHLVAALAGAGRPADAVSAFHEGRAALLAAGRPVGAALADAAHAILDRPSAPVPRRAGTTSRPPRVPTRRRRDERGRRRPVDGAGPRPPAGSTVVCARFGSDAAHVEQECVALASGLGAVVTRRPGGLVVAVLGPGDDATDLALALSLSLRRLSREAGVAAPAVTVVGGSAHRAARLGGGSVGGPG